MRSSPVVYVQAARINRYRNCGSRRTTITDNPHCITKIKPTVQMIHECGRADIELPTVQIKLEETLYGQPEHVN